MRANFLKMAANQSISLKSSSADLKFAKRKKELNRVNNTQVDNNELKKIRKNEKKDRKLLFMTSYFSLFSFKLRLIDI